MNPSSLVERWQLIQAINADPVLSASAKTVAVALLGFVNSRSGECYPTLEKIMAHSHVSKATAVRATKALESQGWVRIERDVGGDRESNRYHFVFNRIRGGSAQSTASGEAPGADEVHGIKFKPCDGVHGVKSERSMASNFPDHGVKSEPELGEDNSFTGTQESPLGENGLPEIDHETWARTIWCPQYPSTEYGMEGAVKKIVTLLRRGAVTREALLNGVLRYGESEKVRKGFIMNPIRWLNDGCWTAAGSARTNDRRMSAAEEAVWRAG